MQLGAVTVSLHPAGHVLGSAQVRIAHHGQVCVISGDYKLALDPTCHAFEPLRCHTFITESTFGLPVYRWPDARAEVERLHQWWRDNQAQGLTSILLAYSLGKAQRLLTLLDRTIGPMAIHPAIAAVNQAYLVSGVRLPELPVFDLSESRNVKGQGLILAPPNAGPALKRRLRPCAVASASGWMAIRGQRRRQGLDAGFVISDHADWPGLLSAIEATEAEQVGVTHGYVQPLVRYLQEHGRSAQALATPWGVEGEEEG
jgi:putative mRNA 3-end processing factor